jgi:uncharacterized protein (TIGR02145 family)
MLVESLPKCLVFYLFCYIFNMETMSILFRFGGSAINLIAALLCASLLLSCSTVERDNPYDQRSPNYNGWVFGKGNDISNYRTVQIGDQTWMAENLSYDASGSKCYNNNTANCATYGMLYDWSTAMALPSSCNSTSCASQINAKHRGICPSGWHIPSDAEWSTLSSYVEGDKGCSGCDARHLKASSGWSSNGSGTDAYGFSALPGGRGYSNGSFYDVGNYGYWWSASEYDSYNAYYRDMRYYLEYVYYDYNNTCYLYSVRCLQD